MLKRARDYRLYSRTMMPIVAVYSAGYAIGHLAYFASGNLGLIWGPLGELRRSVIAGGPTRPFPASGWMNWVPVLLCGGFLVSELRRQGRRVAARERLLLAAYAVATLSAGIVVLSPHLPEALYGPTAVLAAALFVWARWRKWPRSTRVVALGVAGLAAGLAMLLLRLRDMARLGHMG